jgi:hypothetical protein
MSSRMIAVVSCASWEVVGLADDLARIGATSELVVGFMDVQWTHATHGTETPGMGFAVRGAVTRLSRRLLRGAQSAEDVSW